VADGGSADVCMDPRQSWLCVGFQPIPALLYRPPSRSLCWGPAVQGAAPDLRTALRGHSWRPSCCQWPTQHPTDSPGLRLLPPHCHASAGRKHTPGSITTNATDASWQCSKHACMHACMHLHRSRGRCACMAEEPWDFGSKSCGLS